MRAACKVTTYECLDFHHLFDKQHLKRFSLGAYNMYRRLPAILEEVSICVVVCANCHRKIHEGIAKEPRKRKKIKITPEEWAKV